jgi:hypothetical protein
MGLKRIAPEWLQEPFSVSENGDSTHTRPVCLWRLVILRSALSVAETALMLIKQERYKSTDLMVANSTLS